MSIPSCSQRFLVFSSGLLQPSHQKEKDWSQRVLDLFPYVPGVIPRITQGEGE